MTTINVDKDKLERLIQLVGQMETKANANFRSLYEEYYPKDLDERGYYYCTYSDDDEEYNEKLTRWIIFTNESLQMFLSEFEGLLNYFRSVK